jgi:ABC-type phosphate transport system substrate-binding protein
MRVYRMRVYRMMLWFIQKAWLQMDGIKRRCHKKGLLLLATRMGLAFFGRAWAGAPAASPLTFAGSGSTLPMMRLLAKAFEQLVQTHAFVFLPQTLSAEAKAFVDFVRSPEGGKLLRANGYLQGE